MMTIYSDTIHPLDIPLTRDLVTEQDSVTELYRLPIREVSIDH